MRLVWNSLDVGSISDVHIDAYHSNIVWTPMVQPLSQLRFVEVFEELLGI